MVAVPAKAPNPMWSRLAGKVMEERLPQSRNASSPMETSPFGRSTLANDRQDRNVPGLIEVRFSGKSMALSPEHSRKASRPMKLIPAGRVMLLRDVQK